MRLVSAACILAVGTLVAGCTTGRLKPPGDATITHQLAELGIEGRTYFHDLGQLSSMHIHAIHEIDDDLLIEDIHGHLTYVDGATLNVRWECYQLPDNFDEAPDFTPSAIVGVSKGRLFVINRAYGDIEINRALDVVTSAAPVANDSTMYVPTFHTPAGNKTVYAVSLGNGYVGWGWRGDDEVVADLAKGGPLGGDTFYFASSEGGIWAYPTEVATGIPPDPAWYRHAYARVERDLVVDGDDLGVVASDGRMIILDRITGGVRWEAFPATGERAGSGAQFGGDLVMYVCGGELRAFDRATGAKVWAVAGADRFVAQREGRVLLTGAGDMVYSVDRASGEVVSKVHMPRVHLPRRGSAGATVYAVTDRGAILGVELGW